MPKPTTSTLALRSSTKKGALHRRGQRPGPHARADDLDLGCEAVDHTSSRTWCSGCRARRGRGCRSREARCRRGPDDVPAPLRVIPPGRGAGVQDEMAVPPATYLSSSLTKSDLIV